MSTNNHVLRRGKIGDKFMDYFTKSRIFSVRWLFTYVGNKLYLHKKRKLLLVTNINYNLGKFVADRTVSEPKCHFQQ